MKSFTISRLLICITSLAVYLAVLARYAEEPMRVLVLGGWLFVNYAIFLFFGSKPCFIASAFVLALLNEINFVATNQTNSVGWAVMSAFGFVVVTAVESCFTWALVVIPEECVRYAIRLSKLGIAKMKRSPNGSPRQAIVDADDSDGVA